MKDFDVAKYLREHQMGSYGILNHYIDLKPLKEEGVTEDVTPEEIAEIPYEGPDDEPETVSEEEVEEEWHPEMTPSTKEELIANVVEKLKGAGISIIQLKQFIDSQLEKNPDTAVFETISEDDFEAGSEQENFNRMMGLIDRTLETQLPKIKNAVDKARERGLKDMAIFNMLKTYSLTGPTVQDLVDDGFEAQDIVDFFATDFSQAETISEEADQEDATSEILTAFREDLKFTKEEILQFCKEVISDPGLLDAAEIK